MGGGGGEGLSFFLFSFFLVFVSPLFYGGWGLVVMVIILDIFYVNVNTIKTCKSGSFAHKTVTKITVLL